MTGFGRCLVESAVCSQQWEIRSVNGKFLEIKWRLPPPARCLEQTLEKIVRQSATRGRVDINLQLQFKGDYSPGACFDLNLVRARLASLSELAASRGETFTPDYTALLSMAEYWGERTLDDEGDLAPELEKGLRIALDDWNESREIEGEKLAADLLARATLLGDWTEILRRRAPEIREERIAALRERLEELLEQNARELDEDRFLQEIIILTDRLDVSEELTRLASHLERLRQLLEQGGETGRKLDFTLQECFREINTCGNKLPDPQLSRLVVDFKNELEKCREQAQNLE